MTLKYFVQSIPLNISFLLQSDIAGTQSLCAANCMKLNSVKLRLLSLVEEHMVFIVLVHYGTFVYSVRKLSKTVKCISIQNFISAHRYVTFPLNP